MRAAATTAAVLLVIASAGFGIAFAYTQGAHHGPALAGCAVAMALGLELAKPFACEAVLDCIRRLAIGRALAMLALAAVAICYSLTAELSLMASTRGDAAATRVKASTSVADDRAELARLLAERSAIPGFAPATGETVDAAREAVKAAATVRAAECAKRGTQCRAREADEAAARAALAKAIADKAATDRAAKLDADAARVRARLATASPVAAAADPGAAALAGYLATFGVTVPATLVAQWLTLVGVIALEVGSALSVMLVRAAGGASHRPSGMASVVDVKVDSRTEARSARRQSPSSRAADSATGAAVSKASPKRTAAKAAKGKLPGPSGKVSANSSAKGRGRPPRERKQAETAILGQLKANGGMLPTSSPRKLGAMLSVRKSTAHSALLGLIAAGAVAKAAGGALVRTAGA